MIHETFLACVTCANNFKDTGGEAAGWSILFLLGVVLAILGGVGFFMVRLALRSNASLDPELRDDHPIHHG